MIVLHTLPEKPPPYKSNLLRATNAPSIEAGLPLLARKRRVGRFSRFVRTDFDPTTPGGASMKRAA